MIIKPKGFLVLEKLHFYLVCHNEMTPKKLKNKKKNIKGINRDWFYSGPKITKQQCNYDFF